MRSIESAPEVWTEVSPMTVCDVLIAPGSRRPVSRKRKAKQVPMTVVLSDLNLGFWGRQLWHSSPRSHLLYSPRVDPVPEYGLHLLACFGMSLPRLGDKRLTSPCPHSLSGPLACQLWFNQPSCCEMLCGEAPVLARAWRRLQSGSLKELSPANTHRSEPRRVLPRGACSPCGRPSVTNTVQRFLGPVLGQGQCLNPRSPSRSQVSSMTFLLTLTAQNFCRRLMLLSNLMLIFASFSVCCNIEQFTFLPSIFPKWG